MQALTRYRASGPEELKPVGETQYVAQVTTGTAVPQVAAGIVGYADLRLGGAVRGVLEAHLEAGRGRFRGVRHLTTWDADASLSNPLTAAPEGLMWSSAYRAGLAQLAPLGLSYDAWLFFPQLPELIETAKALPDTTIIVDHCGGVVRIGAYQESPRRGVRALEARRCASWRACRTSTSSSVGSACASTASTSTRASCRLRRSSWRRAWKPWIETCIEAFGAERCMFESNFPVDKGSYGYAVGWNAFKRLTAHCSAGERRALFEGTATRVYRLD